MINFRQFFLTFILLGAISYFAFHTFFGTRGYFALNKLNNSIQITTITLQNLRSERLELDHTAKLLRPDSLDRDMLDEQARKILGLARSGEKIIIVETDPSVSE